jgi:trimeric autotransporter adhesin
MTISNYKKSRRLSFIAMSVLLLLNTTQAQVLNTHFGENSLSVNTGNNNSAFGAYALSLNTTGGDNTATGVFSLYANTSGFGNTAVGGLALYSNTTGYLNSAFGEEALRANIDGTSNTAVGVDSLYNNTSGSDNVAVGYDAMFSSTTAKSNTAIGTYSLFSNLTGNSNTAAGYLSLFSNTTGAENTASGYNTLYANTTGANNAGFGAQSLSKNTVGAGNTAVGYQALSASVSGNNNVALGYRAGVAITGSNNIAIGSTGVASESKTIRIGEGQTKTFIAGISGVRSTGGVQVYINSSGQLGTLTSSKRFKRDIKALNPMTEKLMQLRPVSYYYKDTADVQDDGLQYGLIAEEVAKIFPELVQYDADGKPFTVYYHLLTPLLLNQVQQSYASNQTQQAQIGKLNQELIAQRAEMSRMQAQHQSELASLEKKLKQLDALVQRSVNSNNASHQLALVEK